MSRLNTNKELASLEDLARDQGWTLDRTDGGHIEWRGPKGQLIISASTPSRSTIPNIKSDLKAAGLLLDKGEVLQMKRSKRAQERECERRMNAIHDALHDGGYPISVEMDRQDIDEEIELLLFNRILPDGKGFDLKCECGKHCAHPTGFIAHYKKCLVVQQQGGAMDRDLNIAPPQEQRLDCPDCGQFYWNTQPHLLASHMRAEHGKELCLFCQKYFNTRSIARHARACEIAMAPVVEPIIQSDPIPVETNLQLPATDYGAHIGTPEELTIADADGWRPAVVADDESDEEQNGVSPHIARNRGLIDRVREVMAEIGEIGEPDPIKQLHSLVGMDVTIDVLQNTVKSLVDKKEIIREMSTPRRTRSLQWAAATIPTPPRQIRQVEVVLTDAPPASERFQGVAQAVQAAGIDLANVTDDELWSLLEMVLDGPIAFNRANYALITEWMEVTRKLFQLKAQG